MKRNILLITLAILFTLGIGGYYLNKNRDTVTTPKSTVAVHDKDVVRLEKLSGDAYDTQFITSMSEHHAGAVAMAQRVVADAKHPELKTLATNIIAAQTKELSDMKAWAASWGYSYTPPSQAGIDEMVAGLKGKTGDALDEQFLIDMMGHHQSAISMASLSASRANHQDIKDLSKNVIQSQSAEMNQMMEHMTAWGYQHDMDSGSMSSQNMHM